MTFKYNDKTLKAMEALLKDAGFVVRYEKGQFNSGYCLLESKQVVVINRYFTLESKINVLLDIIAQVQINREQLDEDAVEYLDFLLAQKEAS